MEQQIVYPTQWQLGKPRGSIKKELTYFLARITPPNKKTLSKYFYFQNYKNKDEAYKNCKE